MTTGAQERDKPGTYALLLATQTTGPVRIGRLGVMQLQPGSYLYVGSAFGSGGLSARINHHCRITTHPHWHIDYLRAACDLVEVWSTTEKARREHSWAKTVAKLPGATIPMRGFGSSDCKCETHLFWFQKPPSVKAFGQRVRTLVSTTRLTAAERRSG